MYSEFKIRFFKLEELNQAQLPTAVSAPKPTQTQVHTGASAPKPAQIQVPTAAAATKPKQRRNKRATVSPTSARRGKKSRSEQSLPPPTTALSESENSLMEESDFSDDSSEKQVILKDVPSAAVSGVSDAAVKGDDPPNSDEAVSRSFAFHPSELHLTALKSSSTLTTTRGFSPGGTSPSLLPTPTLDGDSPPSPSPSTDMNSSSDSEECMEAHRPAHAPPPPRLTNRPTEAGGQEL
ncbi:hypothetical protein TNCT_388081 [Trichonephila clavata]|uniref:Uncharacterized protein n=1 Tax=Trichonephila clavata TaxID=2740835 RepID=A0A8X6HTL0_TRICU|nr:hypothetical protein TNCT_388081 [Trichonephila clavata]